MGLLERTTPWERYEMAQFEYAQRVGMLSTLSVVANAQLAHGCQAVTLAESQREAAVMAVLLGGSIRGRSESDREGGQGKTLETVVRRVYDDRVDRERVGWVDEVIEQVVGDAVWAGDATEVTACDRAVVRTRLALYGWLCVWRRVATDHLGISLAELLALTHVAEAGLGSVGKPVDEALCERVLGDVDVSIERYREHGADEDLTRETLAAEADSLAAEVIKRFELPEESEESPR
ncbi:hypothetical protein C2R22_13435 [Salinigranum rubrum]|uniref:Uncharacterized protein n=1 Tax=Salinigranum rubrum TaxID=755307 RepID=A0A2I8VKT0_9EURY|nr:hypothetical protein [Salinigranum rubrum]AUV82518.1 hypothetical protein C2R22_13435 [Salinigranum rubrum]